MKTMIATVSMLALLATGVTTYRLTAAPAPASSDETALTCVPANVYTTPEARRHLTAQPTHWRAFLVQR